MTTTPAEDKEHKALVLKKSDTRIVEQETPKLLGSFPNLIKQDVVEE